MSSLLERIATRRAELAEAAQHLTKQLADVQHELDRMSVAEQVVTKMLAEAEPRRWRPPGTRHLHQRAGQRRILDHPLPAAGPRP